MKYASIDIETAGLRHNSLEDIDTVFSIAIVLDDLYNRPPLEELPYLHIYVDVGRVEGNIFALHMNKQLITDISYLKQAGVEPDSYYKEGHDLHFVKEHHVLEVIQEFLKANRQYSIGIAYDKLVFNVAGKNALAFDVDFLNKKFLLNTVAHFKHRDLDPSVLYYQPGDLELPSLGICKERAGLGSGVAHTALEDAMDVVKLLRHKLT